MFLFFCNSSTNSLKVSLFRLKYRVLWFWPEAYLEELQIVNLSIVNLKLEELIAKSDRSKEIWTKQTK